MIIILKLIIMPFFGLLFVYVIALKNNLLPNALEGFYLASNFTTPVAINMIGIAFLNKFQVENTSKIIICSYFFGIISVTFWLTIFIKIFFG